MAVLITVLECDSCQTVAALKTDADWQNFSNTWSDGYRLQFCPSCRATPESEARIKLDEQILVDLAAQITKGDSADVEYAN